MSLCLLMNTKEDILKNNGNQTFFLAPYLVEKNTVKVNGAKVPIVLHNLPLCSAEDRNSYRFATT